MAVHWWQVGHGGQKINNNFYNLEVDMKKIGCVLLVILFLAMNLGMANTPATMNHKSVPMSSQEMSSIVGGKLASCSCGGDACCCCLNFWIIEICGCVFF
jgi:hypothetical protein